VNRAQQIGYELPEAIDLMYLSVSSGVSLNSAMQKVTENQSGAAAGELTRVLEEMRLGVSRAQAFRSLIERISQPDMVRFAEAMIKIDQLGISLTTVLEEQAREMRQRRRALAREKAQQVSVRILMPLVLCFLPGLFIIVLGPAVASIFNLFAT
jgi:tight adherence protein C